jgi:hypothetical protein
MPTIFLIYPLSRTGPRLSARARGGIRTLDLRIMSPESCNCATTASLKNGTGVNAVNRFTAVSYAFS